MKIGVADFAAAERYFNSLINYEHRFPLGGNRDWPKLEPTLSAVERLRLPLSLPRCFHIAGTKGKGSVAAFLESLLAPDFKTLSFTSPHLVSIKERVRANGREIPDEIWCRGVAEIADTIQRDPPIRLSYFETSLIFALWVARQTETEAHVMECGLGGRWDATNVLQDTIPVLTPVDYDHTDVLGDTLEKIALEKGGIVKGKCPVIVGPQAREVTAVYEAIIKQQGAHGSFFGKDFGHRHEPCGSFAYAETGGFEIPAIRLSVRGAHQTDNAVTAIRALRVAVPQLSPDSIRERLASCDIPGRQQLLPGVPEILVDVAHNPVSFAALAETLKMEFAGRRKYLVMGMMKDKDARSCLIALGGRVDQIRFVEVNSPRSRSAADLSSLATELGMDACTSPSREHAFEWLHELGPRDLGVVAGSFYLVGDYLVWRRHAGIA